MMKDGEEEEVVTVPIRQSARIAARHAPTEVVAEVVADTTPVAPRASITDRLRALASRHRSRRSSQNTTQDRTRRSSRNPPTQLEETPLNEQEETPLNEQEETPLNEQEETPLNEQEETPLNEQEVIPLRAPKNIHSVLNANAKEKVGRLAASIHSKHSVDFFCRRDWPKFDGFYVNINEIVANKSGTNENDMSKKKRQITQISVLASTSSAIERFESAFDVIDGYDYQATTDPEEFVKRLKK
ncbi:MAG: hypothetical protein AAGM67_00145 [Bacteroidota bacterium]